MAGVDRRRSALALLDTGLFVFAGVASAWLAYLLLRESFQPNWRILLLLVFWALVAYLVLPRVHRVLTRIYLPGYFIGRTRTSDGLLGDPVNLALRGGEAQIHAAMEAAGWTRADDVDLASSMRIVTSTLRRQSYAEAPVSPLHLFDRQQDFAYQQEVAGNPAKRHHVRFWRCPEGWLLPGGYGVDWLAAGTYDRSVGLSLFTLQVTHRIAEDVDVERDHIVSSVTTANPPTALEVIRGFSSGYHSRNGGGDAIETDGDLPILDLTSVGAPQAVAPVATDSRDRRPVTTVFGASVACLRGLAALLAAAVFAVEPSATDVVPAGTTDAVIVAVVGGFGLMGVGDIALGVGTYLGHNWTRILLMLFDAGSIVAAVVGVMQGAPAPTLGSGLPVVSLGILVLLALSSDRSREFATRVDHPAGPVPPALSRGRVAL